MNLTKISQAAGVRYLLATVATGDTPTPTSGGQVATSPMHAYYVATGTPPGVWLGAGAEAAGITPGMVVTADAATALFSQFRHPLTGAPLGAHRRLHTNRDGADAPVSVTAVAGYDLTIRVPKSVSALFAIADAGVREQILAAHHQAIAQTLAWLEREVARTRSGRGGVVATPVRGLLAARYDHWDNRNGDPHLHSHLAVANRVQRASDGKWLTLDGKALYRAAVAASEHHENLLLDELARTLGATFTERQRATDSTRSIVLDVDGVPTDVVERFSSRDHQIRALTEQLLATWRVEHPGIEPGERTRHQLAQHAWRATRQPKTKQALPLSTRVALWRSQVTALGHDPATIIATAVGHDPVPDPIPPGDLPIHLAGRLLALHTHHTSARHTTTTPPADEVDLAAASAVEAVMSSRATWTRANLHAEASRLTRHVRCATPAERERLVEAITTAAVGRCESLTPHRYRLPAGPTTAPPTPGSASPPVVGWLEDEHARILTHPDVLQAEAYLHTRAATPTPATIDPGTAEEVLAAYAEAHTLAPDQATAALAVTTQASAVVALVGPAGSGKTTTVRAIRTIWEHTHGTGSVLALATAAAELADATGIPATTLAKVLHENTPQRVAERHLTRLEAEQDARSGDPRRRAHAARVLTRLDVTEAACTLRAGQLVVVDEASMTGTFDLAHLARLAERAGAKLLLVGDPAQLDAPAAGGFLGWLDRTHQAHHLTSLWRFAQDWEKHASLRLRSGDTSVFTDPATGAPGGPYLQHGRIREGIEEDVLQAAHTHVQDALAQGRSAILIAATNAQVADLNTRATLQRRAEGHVSTARTVAMRTGMAAGTGDVVLLRRTDRAHTDTAGRFVANGDLVRVHHIAPDGVVTLTRLDAGHTEQATLRLPGAWLGAHAELGYAVTAHRSQGLTVDEGHLVITAREHLPRELLYVALTRGRENNTAWIGIMDQATAAETHTPLADIPTGIEVLTRCLTSSQAELTAHETRDREHHTYTSLARLLAERDHLTAHTAHRTLATRLREIHGDDVADRVIASPAWDALAATWHHAHTHDPDRTTWLLTLPLDSGARGEGVNDDGGASDGEPAPEPPLDRAIRLRQLLDRSVNLTAEHATTPGDPLTGLRTPTSEHPDGDDGGVADLIRQCDQLIDQRLDVLRARLDHTLVPLLPPRPPAGHPDAGAWDAAGLAALAYADIWGHSVLAPTGDDERRTRHQERVLTLLRHWDNPPAPEPRPGLLVDPHHDVEWDVTLPEAYTPDLDAQITDPDAAPGTPSRAGSAARGSVPFTLREHTDYDRRLTRALETAWEIWQNHADDGASWVPDYLTHRGLPADVAGHAPAGWTTTLDALQHCGFTTAELLDAGLVRLDRHARPIDRFRDRLALPIRDAHGRLVGFTARKHPDLTSTCSLGLGVFVLVRGLR